MAELPVGTVTFFMTDLEGSTRSWEERPAAMESALVAHDALLRDAIESHGGVIIDHAGDGMAAAFASANDSIAAALQFELRILEDSDADVARLRPRVALHAAEGQLRTDGRYVNRPLNRCARLLAAGHGGQVLASESVASLVRGELPSGVELLALGEHRLRDLARPLAVYQVVAPGLVREFPRLASLDPVPGNLPSQPTSFVGRDDDVARIGVLLEDAALVSLTGTGGVGKTRLAIQAAAGAAARFGDGVWFCELAPADDGEAMAQVVATVLSCRPHPGLSLAQSIVEYLKFKELLLVLDNCEHLLDDAGAFADAVVRSCPAVRVLATSREALDVAGERVVRVRSLVSPPVAAGRDELSRSAAVQLFADRARDAGADREWDDPQWQAVGEICRRVDGIPLAIELAAARMTSMSPAEVAEHLDERFWILTGKRRGRVQRHQTLKATVEWSYQLLDREERVVFDRLGVFAGTFDASAAEAVAGGAELDGWEIRERLASLVAKSMVVADTGADGTTRYGLHETLRQFGRDRLDELGDTDTRRRALAEHYTQVARDIGVGLTGSDYVSWALRLRSELDNLRAAIGWALERSDAERRLALEMLASLESTAQASPTGFGPLAVEAADAARAAGPELRAPVLTIAAYCEWNAGRTEHARELAAAALEDGLVVDTVSSFAPYVGAVVFEMTAGNHARALAIADEARAAIDTVDDLYARALGLAGISTFVAMAGQVEQARSDATRATALARASQNIEAIAVALIGVMWAYQRDEPAAALTAAEEYFHLYREHGVNAGGVVSALAIAGGLRSRLGDSDGAFELFSEGVALGRDLGVRPQLASVLDFALLPLVRGGRPEVAAVLLGALTEGALAAYGGWPGVATVRTRALERAHDQLDDRADSLLARGTAMSYDELVEYALEHLRPSSEPRHSG